jgi:cell wall-associated NlpC family hydrolase
MVADLVGIPYKIRGRDKNGMDCLGLAIEVLRRGGITLKDVFYEDTETETNKRIMESMEASIPNTKLEGPEKNCIIEFIVFGQPSHIGVYLGDGEFIHASRQFGVVVDKLHRWQSKVKGYYRVK